MKILLKDIKEDIKEYRGEVICEEIENNGDKIRFTNPIVFEGILRKGDDFLEISGNITAKYLSNCHACGNEAKNNVEFGIFETYRRVPGEDEYLLDGDEVDFDNMILENIRLNLPVKILCRSDCKGICTICGKNLNESMCDCEIKEEKTSPFDVLKNLLDK